MDQWVSMVVAAAMGALIAWAITWFAAKAKLASVNAELRVAQAAADPTLVHDRFRALADDVLDHHTDKAEAAAEFRLRSTEQLLAPLREGLAEFNARLNEVEQHRAAQSAALAAHVRSVESTGEALRRETAALSTALKKPQVRGAWGELQLRRIVELAGMTEKVDFVTQETTRTSTDTVIRPDLKVHLGEGRFVYVDAKTPLAAWLEALEADEQNQPAFLAQFGRHIRTHIDQLSAKDYFKADPGSPEFVVLFLPGEAIAAQAAAAVPDLHEYAAARNIVVASPTSLIAMLRAIAYGWKQTALAASAQEVFHLGRELYDRLATLGSHVDKVGRSLNASVRAYNTALGSLESRVLVSARRFRDLQVSEAELIAPEPVEASARPVTVAELVTEKD